MTALREVWVQVDKQGAFAVFEDHHAAEMYALRYSPATRPTVHRYTLVVADARLRSPVNAAVDSATVKPTVDLTELVAACQSYRDCVVDLYGRQTPGSGDRAGSAALRMFAALDVATGATIMHGGVA